jgi:hypothetical protein
MEGVSDVWCLVKGEKRKVCEKCEKKINKIRRKKIGLHRMWFISSKSSGKLNNIELRVWSRWEIIKWKITWEFFEITVDDDESWLSFIKISYFNHSWRNFKPQVKFISMKKTRKEKKLSTKYVGNLKINISSDSSTHQQKAG